MSAPIPAIVNLPPLAEAVPGGLTAPMSRLDQPAGRAGVDVDPPYPEDIDGHTRADPRSPVVVDRHGRQRVAPCRHVAPLHAVRRAIGRTTCGSPSWMASFRRAHPGGVIQRGAQHGRTGRNGSVLHHAVPSPGAQFLPPGPRRFKLGRFAPSLRPVPSRVADRTGGASARRSPSARRARPRADRPGVSHRARAVRARRASRVEPIIALRGE
jgi:hypothetical protein